MKKILLSLFFLLVLIGISFAASSRQKGTSEHISTYGGVTRNYTSLQTWEADTDVDLVTLTKSEVLEIYDDAASFNDFVTLADTTTNASYFRIIRPAPGQGHDGTPNNGVTFICTTDTTGIRINESYSQVQDIIYRLNIDGTTTRYAFNLTATYTKAVGCIAYSCINAGTAVARGFHTDANNAGFINCLSINGENQGFSFSATTGTTTYAYNCTAYGNGSYGFSVTTTAGTGTTVWTNCLSSGNTTAAFVDLNTGANTITATYCSSNDATADDWLGAGNRINQTFTFVNSAGGNFHLVSTDVGARNWGTDLSEDAIFPFNDDIDKGKRPGQNVWDIGFDEFDQKTIMGGGLGDTETIMSPPSMW